MGDRGFSFGWWLKQARTDLGISQRQLALLIGVSVRTIRNWEKNTFKPAPWNISHLSACLDCPQSELFDLSEYGHAS
jgi:DNA-binding XRE family transcriptional regulator